MSVLFGPKRSHNEITGFKSQGVGTAIEPSTVADSTVHDPTYVFRQQTLDAVRNRTPAKIATEYNDTFILVTVVGEEHASPMEFHRCGGGESVRVLMIEDTSIAVYIGDEHDFMQHHGQSRSSLVNDGSICILIDALMPLLNEAMNVKMQDTMTFTSSGFNMNTGCDGTQMMPCMAKPGWKAEYVNHVPLPLNYPDPSIENPYHPGWDHYQTETLRFITPLSKIVGTSWGPPANNLHLVDPQNVSDAARPNQIARLAASVLDGEDGALMIQGFNDIIEQTMPQGGGEHAGVKTRSKARHLQQRKVDKNTK